jgi:hypothetical protein
VIRSDSGVAHRLSLSARVLSALDGQVKAKALRWKPLWRLQNRPLMSTRLVPQTESRDGLIPPPIVILPGYYYRTSLLSGLPSNPGLEAKGLFAFPGAIGLASWPARWRRLAVARSAPAGAGLPRSLLVIIVVAVIVRLIGFLVRHVALVGEQLGMRTALDRLAA